ncbi:hypothetical protein TWF694_000151 [Orbilia ellipsospora]|uniref:Uncharacterized protein n=1 Tax=Orbilia ellipsospora TaxID=2528407 RepID=A0AAV9XQC7_9PEZI
MVSNDISTASRPQQDHHRATSSEEALDPRDYCTCHLDEDDPGKPYCCACSFDLHELHSDSRFPKLSLEDAFRGLCAILWDTSNPSDWREVLLYHFVCDGDADFSRCANLASSLVGRLKKSRYGNMLKKMEPGEGWDLYDKLKLDEKSLLWRANFESQRGEDSGSDYLGSTAVSSHNAEITSVYDPELDYYPSRGDNHYTNHHNGNEESASAPGDGDGYSDDQEHRSYHNYRAGSTPYNRSRDDNMSIRSESEQLASVDGAKATRQDDQDHDDRASGISFRHRVRENPHLRHQSQDTHYDEGEPSGGNGAEYYTDHDHDHENNVTSGPASSTVSLITHLAPRIQESGGEVKIDRYGSATIRFLSPRKNEL